MNAPFTPPVPPTGSPDELRAYALALLEVLGEYQIAADALARVGDDMGFARTTQKIVAVTIALGETVADLRRRQC